MKKKLICLASCNASDGETGAKVEEIIEKTRGGVLFIDEAKQLDPSRGGSTDGGTNYYTQACEALVNGIDDKPSDQCVIMAGYKPEMESLFNCKLHLYRTCGYTLT